MDEMCELAPYGTYARASVMPRLRSAGVSQYTKAPGSTSPEDCETCPHNNVPTREKTDASNAMIASTCSMASAYRTRPHRALKRL